MSIAIVGSSHVIKLQQQLQRGAIYDGGKLDDFPHIEWLGKSGLTAAELSDMGSPVTRDFQRRLQFSEVQTVCLIIGSNDLDNLGDKDARTVIML